MSNHQAADSSSQQPITQPDLQHANAILDSISAPKDSQPTKLRVKNFKNRVFNLLKIYTQESQDINPLIQCLKQEMFFSEPEKMQELLHAVLNKQNVTLENLKQLAEYYKVILLYKADQKGDAIAMEFVRLIKKLASLDQQLAHGYILSMLKSFAYERKCRLNINFFFYFFRKYEHPQEIKKTFIEKLQQYLQDDKLRNAQKKQLTKILQRLDKSTRVKNGNVKKEEEDAQIEEEGDIKATNKKNSGLVKVKKHQEDKIEEEGQQNKTNQVSEEQQEKLERIKANKKKNRKGINNNKGQKPARNEQKHHNQKQHQQSPKPQQSNEQRNKSQEKKSLNNNGKTNSQQNKQANNSREQSNSKPKFSNNNQHQKPNQKFYKPKSKA